MGIRARKASESTSDPLYVGRIPVVRSIAIKVKLAGKVQMHSELASFPPSVVLWAWLARVL